MRIKEKKKKEGMLFCQQHGSFSSMLPVLFPIQLSSSQASWQLYEVLWGRKGSRKCCLLMHLCSHHSRVRLQEDDKIAE